MSRSQAGTPERMTAEQGGRGGPSFQNSAQPPA